MSKRRLNQSGAVTMLTVVIFSIILTLVTTAYLRSVVSQQRNAFNYDLSNRAYYAAEAGVQDAIRALPTTDKTGDCTPLAPNTSGTVGATNNYGLSYTCQLVTLTPGEIDGMVEPNARNATIRLEPSTIPSGGGPYKLVVRWSQQQADPTEQVYYPRATGDRQFPPTNRWYRENDLQKPIHALLRVNIISHPKSGSFTRDQVKQRVVFLNPTQTASTPAGFRIDVDQVLPQQENLISDAQCVASNTNGFDGYSCKQTILLQDGYNLSNQQLYVRIGSVYHATGFSVTLTDNSNNVIPISKSQAVIDVTGKAGNDVFRRVQQTVSLGGYSVDSLPDAALVSGEGICKLFAIGTSAANYKQGCDPLTNN